MHEHNEKDRDMLTITHTHETGTLIDGTSRGDGTNVVLKSSGWRWGRSISAWYMPHSRDHRPNNWKIERTSEALRAAGFDVELEVDEGFRTTSEVEAGKIARQEDRVEALEDRAGRKEGVGDALWAQAREMGSHIPFGQPILVGHYSEGRDRNYRAKISRTYDRAHEAYQEETRSRAKADTAAHTTDARYAPLTVSNRIERLAAEMRGVQREVDGTPTMGNVDRRPAVGARLERRLSEFAELLDQHTYWVAVRAEQIASGKAGDYSQATVHKGDLVYVGREWLTVVRANPKTISVVYGCFSHTNTTPYARIRGHRPAAAQLGTGDANG